ncbi:17780_t:CDS:2 [Cetraspora pellucida]|uniref:17780_t:CDS:1 n=1 Tax=Cetraspora pellucida TaxID=1433469 RepID=A0ACA9MPT2_9GLOM|nr:17780_t:CDS:2 [Cetraspora pellucida]
MSKNQLLINQLLIKIDQLTVSLEEQKRENNIMKETHTNEVDLYKELINSKTNEITNLIRKRKMS